MCALSILVAGWLAGGLCLGINGRDLHDDEGFFVGAAIALWPITLPIGIVAGIIWVGLKVGQLMRGKR